MTEKLTISAAVTARGVDLDLVVNESEVLAVVGRNGAGKSTLVQLIGGGLRPNNGTVTIGGRTVSDSRTHLPPHKRKCAVVGQRPLLFPHLSVADNVAFGPQSHGAGKRAARDRAAYELGVMEISHLAERRPSQLSGGQAQRVAIARALAIDPDVVLLDEPFAALDAAAAPELRPLIGKRVAGITTVLVTHDILDVLALGHRVIEIADGNVVAEGGVDDIYQRPTTKFLANFVGVNLLHGTIADSNFHADDGPSITGLSLGGLTSGPADVVVPPHAVELAEPNEGGNGPATFLADVIGIEDRRPTQRVTLSVGSQSLGADIGPDTVRDLNLGPGKTIAATLDVTHTRVYRPRNAPVRERN